MSNKPSRRVTSGTLRESIAPRYVVFNSPESHKTWQRLACGVRISDICEKDYDYVLDMFKDHYLSEEPYFRGLRVDKDPEAVSELITIFKNILDNEVSLVAIDEKRGVPCGFLIGKIVHQYDEPPKPKVFSKVFCPEQRKDKNSKAKIGRKTTAPSKVFKSFERVSVVSNRKGLVSEGSEETEESPKVLAPPSFDDPGFQVHSLTLRDLIKFRSTLYDEANFFTKYNTTAYYRIYAFYVMKEWRRRGIGQALLHSCLSQALLNKLKIVVGIFTSNPSQNLAKDFGLEIVTAERYSAIYSVGGLQRLEHMLGEEECAVLMFGKLKGLKGKYSL